LTPRNLSGDASKLTGECVVDEPYEPYAGKGAGESTLPFNLLIIAGLNFSHTYAESGGGYYNSGYYSGSGTYKDIPGFQLGFALDIPTADWLHIQPGLIYVRKGMEDINDAVTAHYLEIPLLLSLKLSIPGIDVAILRVNAGTYFGICLATGADDVFSNDFGLNMGLGFDIDTFYTGIFYEFGLIDISNRHGLDSYNRTLGFNVGMYL